MTDTHHSTAHEQPRPANYLEAAWDAAAVEWDAATVEWIEPRPRQPLDDGDSAYARRWAAWERLIATPAPDAAALAVKVAALLAVFESAVTDNPCHLPFLQELLDSPTVDQGRPVVHVYQDVLRLAGIESPVLDLEPSGNRP